MTDSVSCHEYLSQFLLCIFLLTRNKKTRRRNVLSLVAIHRGELYSELKISNPIE